MPRPDPETVLAEMTAAVEAARTPQEVQVAVSEGLRAVLPLIPLAAQADFLSGIQVVFAQLCPEFVIDFRHDCN